MPIKDGTSANGVPYRSFTCSNHEADCDFFETRFEDLTPPGIRITEDMTAQDIERMREKRRSGKIMGASISSPTQQGGGRRYIPTNRYRRKN